MSLAPPTGQAYGVYAYLLNGELDVTAPNELYGMVIVLGVYPNEHEAAERARTVIRITGHQAVMATRLNTWAPLRKVPMTGTVIAVPTDVDEALSLAANKQQMEQLKQNKLREAITQDIDAERRMETDVDHLEHYRRTLFLALSNREQWESYQQRSQTAHQSYIKRRDELRSHYMRHPEHDAQVMDLLEQKLTLRGETELLAQLKDQYTKHRSELLGLEVEQPPAAPAETAPPSGGLGSILGSLMVGVEGPSLTPEMAAEEVSQVLEPHPLPTETATPADEPPAVEPTRVPTPPPFTMGTVLGRQGGKRGKRRN